MARRGGLGTNLDALIPTSLTVGDKEVGQQNFVEIKDISPNPRQPRKNFDEAALKELIASIQEIGILLQKNLGDLDTWKIYQYISVE